MKFKTLIPSACAVDGSGSPVRQNPAAITEIGRLALLPPGADAEAEVMRIKLWEKLEKDTIGLSSGLSAREFIIK